MILDVFISGIMYINEDSVCYHWDVFKMSFEWQSTVDYPSQNGPLTDCAYVQFIFYIYLCYFFS